MGAIEVAALERGFGLVLHPHLGDQALEDGVPLLPRAVELPGVVRFGRPCLGIARERIIEEGAHPEGERGRAEALGSGDLQRRSVESEDEGEGTRRRHCLPRRLGTGGW